MSGSTALSQMALLGKIARLWPDGYLVAIEFGAFVEHLAQRDREKTR
jgi:hypothetical protein